LVKIVQYIKVENETLRLKLSELVKVTLKERQRLIKFGWPIGTDIREVILIVLVSTYLRWFREYRNGREGDNEAEPYRDQIESAYVYGISADGC